MLFFGPPSGLPRRKRTGLAGRTNSGPGLLVELAPGKVPSNSSRFFRGGGLCLGGLGPRPIARDLRTGGPNGGIADGIDINVNATHALGLRVAIVFGFGLCPVFRFW